MMSNIDRRTSDLRFPRLVAHGPIVGVLRARAVGDLKKLNSNLGYSSAILKYWKNHKNG